MLKRKGKVNFLGRFVAMVMTVVLLITVMPVEVQAKTINYSIYFQNITDASLMDVLVNYYYFVDCTNDKIYNFERDTDTKIIVRNIPDNISYKVMSKDGIQQDNGQITFGITYYARIATIYFYDDNSLVDTKYMLGFCQLHEENVYKPKKDGYVFNGWMLENGSVITYPAKTGYDGIVSHGGSVNLYASWETHEHQWSDEWSFDYETHWHECLTDNCPVEENIEKDGYDAHDMGEWTIINEAKFNEDGLKERECETCDYKEQEVIPKLSNSHIHDFNGKTEVVKEPKCYETGLKNVYCILEECGAYEEQTIDKVSHEYEEEWKYDNVIHYHKCKNCDDCTDNENHQMTEWIVINEPTFLEDGLKERECQTCEYEEEQRIPKLSEGHIHDFNGETEVIKEPKCYEEGLEHVYCTLDGCAAYDEREVDKVPHDYEEDWRYSDVIHYHKCKNCEAIDDEELHEMTEWQVVDVQTYSVRKVEERHCIKCEYSEERTVEETTPEHNHEYTGRWEIVKEPTCTQEGMKRVYCNDEECESFIEENIPNTEHDYEVGWIHNEEIHYHKCKNCEHHIDDEEHDMFETNMVKLATKDSPGIMELECVRCGYVEYEEVPYVEESNDEESNDEEKPENEIPPFTAPQTSDINVVHIYATVAMISGMAYLLGYFKSIDIGMAEETKDKLVDSLIEWAKCRNGIVKGIAILGISVILFYYHLVICIKEKGSLNEEHN